MTTAADLHPDAVLGHIDGPGWFTAEEFRRRHNPKWPSIALRHALKVLVDDGRLETRVDEQALVREYRAVK